MSANSLLHQPIMENHAQIVSHAFIHRYGVRNTISRVNHCASGSPGGVQGHHCLQCRDWRPQNAFLPVVCAISSRRSSKILRGTITKYINLYYIITIVTISLVSNLDNDVGCWATKPCCKSFFVWDRQDMYTATFL